MKKKSEKKVKNQPPRDFLLIFLSVFRIRIWNHFLYRFNVFFTLKYDWIPFDLEFTKEDYSEN